MKKLIVFIFSLFISFTVFAEIQSCATIDEDLVFVEGEKYTDGTYTGTAIGRNSDISVSVNVSDGKINAVNITHHIETKGIDDRAIKEIPIEIIKAQSTEIDVISGATITSNAIIAAVNNALKQKKLVRSFYVCNHEVTQMEYETIMGINPSCFIGNNLPVEQVSLYDAAEYCNKLSLSKGLTPCYKFNKGNVTCDFNANGYRLPTSAEWTYAAQGGMFSSGYIYSGSNIPDLVAWYGFEDDEKNAGNSNEKTHEIKTKQSNELGIYDMSGNVWEWCWDSFPSIHGGSWGHSLLLCRVSSKLIVSPDLTGPYLGFRVVRSVQ